MIDLIIDRIDQQLKTIFTEVDRWFDVNDDLLNFNPGDGGWNIRKILEHISLTNHFLLIIISKGTRKALELSKKQSYSTILQGYDLDSQKLAAIGEHGAFEWKRPEHMEPTGEVSLDEVKSKLYDQLQECIGYLRQMPNGEGILYKTMMSVNNIGKIDVYHYIGFLAQHAQRHITQMKKISEEFKTKKL